MKKNLNNIKSFKIFLKLLINIILKKINFNLCKFF